MPALPLDTAGPYVAGAYLVFLGLVLAYVGIMAAKLGRIADEVAELERLAREADAAAGPRADPAALSAAAERVAEQADPAPAGTGRP